MFKVEDSFIYLTRGDTAYLEIELEDDEKFNAGDKIVLSIKRSLTNDAQYVLQKEVNVNNEVESVTIKIEPEDTTNISYGLYYYDVQLTRSNGDVFTIITPDSQEAKQNFKLLKEVTRNE